MPDMVIEDEECQNRYTRRFWYLSLRLAHFWNRWRREYLTDLWEFRRSKGAERVRVGDVVTVHEENKNCGAWKMAVVESLIKGRYEVLRGANIRVTTKGIPMHISTPIQRLYHIEVRSKTKAKTTQEDGKKDPIVHR